MIEFFCFCERSIYFLSYNCKSRLASTYYYCFVHFAAGLACFAKGDIFLQRELLGLFLWLGKDWRGGFFLLLGLFGMFVWLLMLLGLDLLWLFRLGWILFIKAVFL